MFKGKKYKYVIGGLLVLVVVGVTIGISQWSNIKAVYNAVVFSEDEITQKRQETQGQVNEVLKKYEVEELRTLTEEETNQLLSGEITVEALTEKIAQEKVSGIPEADNGKQPSLDETDKVEILEDHILKEDTKQDKVEEPSIEKLEKEIVSKYTTQMYVLQAKYIGLLEGLKNKGVGVLKNIPSEERTFNRLKAAGMPLLQEANSLESTCDKEVAKVLASLESELKAIKKDTSVIKTMKSAYETEKSLKKAYYISLAKSML